jgi:hypothetical protein
MPEVEYETVICPNGHKVRIVEVRTLEKSSKRGDLGKIECPVCTRSWCHCPKHGAYPCPPPCREAH